MQQFHPLSKYSNAVVLTELGKREAVQLNNNKALEPSAPYVTRCLARLLNTNMFAKNNKILHNLSKIWILLVCNDSFN